MTEEPQQPQHSKRKSLSPTTIVIIILVATATALLASRVAQQQLYAGKEASQKCNKANPTNYTIYIENDQATPQHIEAHQCDLLTITNRDDAIRLIAFGKHDSHTPYDGIETKVLSKEQSFTINLSQTGKDFLVHDHKNDEIQSTFTVTP